MSISFHSSHVTGDCSDGSLVVGITKEDPRAQQTVYDRISFSVPADFHTHNDSVAAALLTLVGSTYPRVRFNFPLSRFCAETLTSYYLLDEVGPVEDALAPRRPGRYLGLNFSGGLDSLTLWLLLTRELHEEIKVITSDYGGQFARERRGFELVARDVTCATDFRRWRYDKAGRFNAAVPLLFADYLDLHSLTSGHTFFHSPKSIESLARGQPPAFVRQELAYHAGGLGEVHLVRGMMRLGMLRIMLAAAPRLIELSLESSAAPTADEYLFKKILLRWMHEQAGLPLPPYLAQLPLPARPFPLTTGSDIMNAVWVTQQIGRDFAARVFDLRHADLSAAEWLTFSYWERYNPNFVPLMPEHLRNRFLDALHAHGIYPYDERDWHELETVRELAGASSAPQLA